MNDRAYHRIMDDDSAFFRYEYRARSILYSLGSIVAVCLGIILTTASLGVLFGFGRKVDRSDQLGMVVILIGGVTGAVAGFVGLWAWTRKWVWRLTASTEKFYWSTPMQEKSIGVANVLQVRITTGESDRISVETRDDGHYNVPRMCLGNVEVLAKELRQRLPTISVVYNQVEL